VDDVLPDADLVEVHVVCATVVLDAVAAREAHAGAAAGMAAVEVGRPVTVEREPLSRRQGEIPHADPFVLVEQP
jgi:hypothetical protein